MRSMRWRGLRALAAPASRPIAGRFVASGRRRRWPIAGLSVVALMAPSAGAAVAYRWVDEDGLIVFSDLPSPRAPLAAQTLTRDRGNVFAARATPKTPAAPPTEAPFAYRSAAVAFPADGAAVRANGGQLVVRARISPPLRAGHRAVLRIDGEDLAAASGPAAGEALSFALEGLPRGLREARIQVLDQRGSLLQSAPARFYLLRAAVARQPRRQR